MNYNAVTQAIFDLPHFNKNNKSSPSEYVIYTDGACLGNSGRGGWASVSICGTVDISGHSDDTTNNVMELTAILNALITVPDNSKVRIITDSRNCIGWLSKRWKCNTNPKIPAMIAEIIRYRKAKSLIVEYKWIKGHGTDEHSRYVDNVARRRCKA